MWINSASCFVKVHFGALMGHIQSGTLLLALHYTKESLQYSDNHVGEQCLMVWCRLILYC